MRTPISPARLLVALMLVASLVRTGLKAADDPPPAPAPLVEAAARLQLPDGFSATLFAGEPDVVQPIAFTIDPRGRLWVAECLAYPDWSEDGTGHDRVLIFEDTDGDGRHDRRTVFADGLSNLSGIELGFGGVWLCSTPNFLFIPDRDGDDRPDGPPEVLLDGWDLDAEHNVFNGLTWGPDGWLYGLNGIMSNSLVGPPGTPDEDRETLNCSVWRFHPTSRQFEVVAHGTTNPWGLDYDELGEFFITNCVIPHLFHVVPGAHYQRMYGQDINPFSYELMRTCADHLHWAGGRWQDSREGGDPAHLDYGGGHAHVGAMIYLGGKWPETYHGSVFTCNLHGHRVNRDTLRPFKSTYVASHAPDFLRSDDGWFRGLELKYGPDGDIYITDWSDIGECHENDEDGAHVENGRIFKVRFDGAATAVPPNLTALTDIELVGLQLHPNHWASRTARRLLQERAADGKDLTAAVGSLDALLKAASTPADRLRLIWAKHAMIGLDDQITPAGPGPSHEAERAWYVRLAADDRDVSPSTLEGFAELARTDPSPRVRLALASAMGRLPLADRWPIAEALATRAEDADDPMVPLMVWYGIEPAVAVDPGRAVALWKSSELPEVRRLIARRLVDGDPRPGLEAILPAIAAADDSARRRDGLAGVLEALRGVRELEPPDSWETVGEPLRADGDPENRERALRLGLILGDAPAASVLRAALLDPESPLDRRLRALDALTLRGDPALVEALEILVKGGTPELVGPAIRALAGFDDPRIPDLLVSRYPNLPPDAKADAVATLSSRSSWAGNLLDEVAAGTIDRRDVSAAVARQIAGFEDDDLSARLQTVWGRSRPTAEDKAARVRDLKQSLTTGALGRADLDRGRSLFVRQCASCHVLFGEGGDVGPDLTGSGRKDLDYLLPNVLDPDASVPGDYRATAFALRDGRLLTGIVREQDDRSYVIQTANERVVVPRSEVEEIAESDSSMMPEGLLDGLDPEEVRDLVAYLMGDLPPRQAEGLRSSAGVARPDE